MAAQPRPHLHFALERPPAPGLLSAFRSEFDVSFEALAPGQLVDLVAVTARPGEDLRALLRAHDPRAIALFGPYTRDSAFREPRRPCFLIVGERDHPMAERAAELRNQLLDGRLIRFPDLGPRAHQEEPRLVARVLRRELEEVPPRRRRLKWLSWAGF